MPWRFRRVIKAGPARLNIGKRGVGTSWGVPGLRFGRSSTGRRYISVGIPGTGLYYIYYFPRRE